MPSDGVNNAVTDSTVGRIVVEAMRAQGVRHAFCVPGESYLGILDAFNDYRDVEVVTTHHEEGAGFMAAAMAQATGGVGVVLVTRGPGVTHLSIALHAARHDSTPLVAIVGHVRSQDIGRDAFQEVDLLAYGRTICKASMEIREPARAAETMHRAFHIARNGRPGPVLVAVPEDVANAQAHRVEPLSPATVFPSPAPELIRRAADLIVRAPSVAFIAGGGVRQSDGVDDLVRLVDAVGGLVYTGFRRFDSFPNSHQAYVGNLPRLPRESLSALRDADVVVAAGTRLGELSTLRYEIPARGQALIHIDTDPEAMAVLRPPDVGVISDARLALIALLASIGHQQVDETAKGRRAIAARAHAAYRASLLPEATTVSQQGVDLASAMVTLREVLPRHGAITSDAGAFSTFLNRYFHWPAPNTFFGTTSGAMGYGVPAAIGVKLADPARPVVAVVGDGGFAMTMSEVHTAARLRMQGLVFLVLDNGTYGTIRLHQTSSYPGREIGVDQGRMNILEVARGLGVHGFRAEDSSELRKALVVALEASGPAVVHAVTDPDQLDAWVHKQSD